jgi:hypothetical protein
MQQARFALHKHHALDTDMSEGLEGFGNAL